jgi:hypothetical protein
MRATVSILAFVLAVLVIVSPALRADQASRDSAEVTALLADAKSEAGQLKLDTAEMETYARSKLSWKTFASKISQIKDHVNKVGELTAKLNNARSGGSPWQQQAIDRINPLLQELGSNVGATINQLNEHQSLVHSTHYREYVQTNHQQATNLASLISDYVEYGKAKDKMEVLAKDLEVPER